MRLLSRKAVLDGFPPNEKDVPVAATWTTTGMSVSAPDPASVSITAPDKIP